MGLQAKARAKRAADRRTQRKLDDAGVSERVRAAYLALQRKDIQDRIREKSNNQAPWAERVPLDRVAASALREFGYNIEDVIITANYRDGEPPIVWFKADASPAAIRSAGGVVPEEPRVN